MIKIEKSIYDMPEPTDGRRILVMTLWPRGISKSKVAVWMKELGSPRDLIARWKKGEVGREEYGRVYVASLKGKEGLLDILAAEAKESTLTLLCACRDPNLCHRSLLKKAIEKRMRN